MGLLITGFQRLLRFFLPPFPFPLFLPNLLAGLDGVGWCWYARERFCTVWLNRWRLFVDTAVVGFLAFKQATEEVTNSISAFFIDVYIHVGRISHQAVALKQRIDRGYFFA